jgi:hypothetical protein
MGDRLTDDERLALEQLRVDETGRAAAVGRSVLDGLVERGLVLVAASRRGERYAISRRGRAALDAPRRTPAAPAGPQ